MDLKEYIKKIPKVELHVHIEGTLTANTAIKLGIKNKRPKQKLPKIRRNKYYFSNFEEFKNCFYYASRCLQTTYDFELLFFEFIKQLESNNIIYAEALFSPLNFKIDTELIVKGALKGLKRAYKKYTTRINIIIDASRNLGSEHVQKGVDLAIKLRSYGLPIIGFSIGGIEKDFPPKLFKNQFDYARSNGLILYAHAGETAGPNYIRSALDDLGVKRIGHGLSLLKNRHLLNFVIQNQIPVDCCISSNISTGITNNIKAHPFKKMYNRGVVVTINTDDPAFFNTTLTTEYYSLVKTLKFKGSDIDRLIVNSINASFASNEYKEDLLKTFHEKSFKLRKSLAISD